MALSSPQDIGENTQKDKLQKYYCDLCCKNCDSANTLSQHLLGNKHKRHLQSIKPKEQNDGTRLGSFLKAHMKEDPIVGLEYIIEMKKDSSYTYSCQLCGLLVCRLPTIVTHLLHPSHTKCYIKKHFSHLFPKFSKYVNVNDLRDAAVKILELQGNKKEIQAVVPESDSKTSKPEVYRHNKMLQKSNSNDPPLAKRSRRSPGGDRDVLPSTAPISKHGSSHYNKSHAVRMDCTATQQLEFRTNDEFFEYFANFVISDDKDVLFIRTITQNCIKALTSFQKEETERQKTGHQPEASLEDTSRTAQKIPGILEDETESHL